MSEPSALTTQCCRLLYLHNVNTDQRQTQRSSQPHNVYAAIIITQHVYFLRFNTTPPLYTIHFLLNKELSKLSSSHNPTQSTKTKPQQNQISKPANNQSSIPKPAMPPKFHNPQSHTQTPTAVNDLILMIDHYIATNLERETDQHELSTQTSRGTLFVDYDGSDVAVVRFRNEEVGMFECGEFGVGGERRDSGWEYDGGEDCGGRKGQQAQAQAQAHAQVNVRVETQGLYRERRQNPHRDHYHGKTHSHTHPYNRNRNTKHSHNRNNTCTHTLNPNMNMNLDKPLPPPPSSSPQIHTKKPNSKRGKISAFFHRVVRKLRSGGLTRDVVGR